MRINYIERARSVFWRVWKRGGLEHALRTGLAAAVSLAIAQLFAMPEAYWAPISTLIVMQSTLGAAWAISKQRLIGTALGAVMGVLVVNYVDRGLFVFGLAIFALGLMCDFFHLNQIAYRFASITLAIIMLIDTAEVIWIRGVHRFVEVSLGIAVGLVFAGVWPWRESKSAKQ